MKYSLLLLIPFVCAAVSVMSDTQAARIADVIYRIEGGAKTKYPYGIKSIDTGGDVNKARRICINTIKNNWKRYYALPEQERKQYHCYLDFLASRYCPKVSDKIGHENWIKNIHYYCRDKLP